MGNSPRPSLTRASFSAVESRLADYLEASAVSARNLQAEKDAIKTLIGDISHQTKTPIANLLLYAQLLGEQPLPPRAATVPRPGETGGEIKNPH